MFHAWRNHQGEVVVVVAGVCLLLYLSLVGFYILILYNLRARGGVPGHRRSWLATFG